MVKFSSRTFLILAVKMSLMIFLLIPLVALAWGDCPFGLIDCSYPGECSRYVDTDNDGICDLSQLAPEDRGTLTIPSEIEIKRRVYHFLPISLILIFFYALGCFSAKKKIISAANHRKIWNILLLITLFISGILGILLLLRLDFGWVITLPFNILFWHVEVGIAMAVISVFHIIWHWSYFKRLFRFKKRI